MEQTLGFSRSSYKSENRLVTRMQEFNQQEKQGTMRQDARFLIGLMLLGTLIYGLLYLAWSLIPGREMEIYLLHALGVRSDSEFFRPPGASYALGFLLSLGNPGALLTLWVAYLLFLLSVYKAALVFGQRTARIVSLLMVCNVQVCILFIKLDGDFLLCLSLGIWSALLLHLFQRERLLDLVLLGFATFVPVYFRQTAIVFGVVCAYPLLCFGFSRKNLFKSLAITSGFVAGLLLLLSYNQVAFGKFSFPSLSGYIPGFHVYRYGPGFSKEFGPENRKFLDLVQQKLIASPVYVENGVGMEEFFKYNWDIRKFCDLIYLDRIVDPGILTRASVESIIASPGTFTKNMFTMVWNLFTKDYSPGLPETEEPPPGKQRVSSSPSQNGSPTPVSSGLPAIPNPEIIPMAYSSTPAALSRLEAANPHSNKEHSQEQLRRFHEKITTETKILIGSGNRVAATVVKTLFIPALPPLLFFLAATPFLLFVQTYRYQARLVLIMAGSAFVLVFFSGIVHQLVEYRLPMDFLFVMGSVAAVVHGPWMRKKGTTPEPEDISLVALPNTSRRIIG
ncbi:MAG: hypothetical protein HQL79_05645 [Magnetococcales bacterium]|nr:hypothetical protein [Magnetococcales bacterium]